MRVIILTFMVAMGLFLISCNNNKPTGYVAKKPNEVQKSPQKSLEKVNRYLLKVENQEIDDYVIRHHWKMESTGSGLRYQIVKQGKGRAIKQGDRVALKYNTFLINGRMIYSSVKLGPKVFEIGHGGVETGLEEALMHFHKGDKANVVIPSFLAYGLNGDGDKIPPRAIVIYSLEVLDVN